MSSGKVEFSTVFLIRITSHTALCCWNACFGSAVVTLNGPKRKSIKTLFSRLLCPVDGSLFPILVKGSAGPGNHRNKKGEKGGGDEVKNRDEGQVIPEKTNITWRRNMSSGSL